MAPEEQIKVILANTYSTAEFARRLGLLREFFEHELFSGHAQEGSRKDTFKKFLAEDNNEQNADAASMLQWSDALFDVFDAARLQEQFRLLEERMQSLPVLQLYLPVDIPANELQKIGKWARTNLKEDMLLEIKIDRSTLGGCGFVWNGTYHDLSLHNLIKQHEGDIRKMIESYGAK